MILKDLTTKIIICKEAKLATSLKDKLFGLLIKSNPRCLIFKTRFGIHTFGLNYPIDVLVLDKNFKIVKIKTGLLPNRLFFWNIKYKLIVELPINQIDKNKLKVGHKLALLDSNK